MIFMHWNIRELRYFIFNVLLALKSLYHTITHFSTNKVKNLLIYGKIFTHNTKWLLRKCSSHFCDLCYSVFVLRRFNINMIVTIMLRPTMMTIAFALVSADVGTVALRVLVNVAAVLPVIVPEALLLVTV